MLTIVDLHQEEELSAGGSAKVAGGAIDTFLKLGDITGEGYQAPAPTTYWMAFKSLFGF
jgi:hypothetical protein